MSALEGVLLKLERAESVIDELEQAVIAYLSERPYEVVGEFERDRSEYVLRGKVTKSTGRLSVIAGDVTHTLRSALDHLAWQLALLNTPRPYDRTQFPIALNPGEFNSNTGQKMISDISAKHRTLIETFQPYNRSNAANAPFAPHALGDLRALSNTDKHRLLNTIVARQARKLQARGLALTIVRDATGHGPVTWFSGGSMDGAELARTALEGVGPDPEVKMEGEIPVVRCFDDPALTHGQPSFIPMLRAILEGVREVVAPFKPDL